jgi:hypothetical protein
VTWHSTTISRVESGAREIRLSELEPVATTFGIEPEMLMWAPDRFDAWGEAIRAKMDIDWAEKAIRDASRLHADASARLENAHNTLSSTS